MKGVGKNSARIMIVGEAPGKNEEEQGIPFVGASGDEFLRMLTEAGLVPMELRQELKPGSYSLGHMVRDGKTDIFLTNVCRVRPPQNKIEKFFFNKTEAKKRGIAEYLGRYPSSEIHDGIAELRSEISGTNPNVIVACGGTALWALTNHDGIMRWRGSTLRSRFYRPDGTPYTVVPIIHPAAILRAWKGRIITVHDLKRRVAPRIESPTFEEPEYKFLIRPDFETAEKALRALLAAADSDVLPLAVDLETRLHSYIACIGLAWSNRDALCIPFMCIEDNAGYWTWEQELKIILLLKKLLTHPNVKIIGQNFEYDRQYILRNWCFKCPLEDDTMTAHHTYQPEMRKALDFLSSLYCQFHQYWKDESKEWEQTMDEDLFWEYCCKDAVVTFECMQALTEQLKKVGQWENYRFQMKQHNHVFYTNSRGIRMDFTIRNEYINLLTDAILEHEGYFMSIIGKHVDAKSGAKNWWDSPQQTMRLLYEWFKVPIQVDKHTKRPTSKNDFFPQFMQDEPLLRPILLRLDNYRSLVQARNVCQMRLWNGRIMTALNIDGPETFRYSSSINAFNEGTNCQNLTSGEKENVLLEQWGKKQ